MKTNLSYDMYLPTHSIFGVGELNHLHEQVMPGKKALIVISNGKSTRSNGYLDRTEEQLRKAGIAWTVFDKIQANPLKASIEEGAIFANANGCDFILALGGGSVMDSAKAIALNAANPGDLWDYVQAGTGKAKPFANQPLPIVAITTTAGTGSEVDSGSVITNPETNEKAGIVFPSLFPVLSIIDPELMLSVPPKFTAYQGFDALFHSTETYVSAVANLMSDMVASTAIRNIGEYLERAYKNGKDIEARTHVAFANTMSGYSMVVGACTSEHSIEHAMSAYHEELPHGAGLIIISKAYYSHLINQHVCDDRFVEMAKMLGKADAMKPEDFIIALGDLQRACDVADLKMSDYGITPDEFDKMATNAYEVMGFLIGMDRKPLSHEDIVEILKASYK